jgi:ferredoxin-NADP reductase
VLSRDRGLRVLSLPGRRRSPGSWLGDHMGDVDDGTALRHWVPDIAERDVYVCGPEPWTDLVRSALLDSGVSPDHIHLETFKW